MNLIRRIAGILAVSLVATQMIGVGTAFATNTSECDFGNNDLEITLGTSDVIVRISDAFLWCGSDGTSESLSLASLKSITVEMEDEDESDGNLYLELDDSANAGVAADWPKFDTFDIDVTTTVYLDGTAVDDTAGNSLRITVGPNSVSFSGTTATSNAPKYYIDGGDLRDTIDGSKATARLEVYGDAGADLIKGGSNRDTLYGDDGLDTIYGGAGPDVLDCGGDGFVLKGQLEYGWGGSGDDQINDCTVNAPGTGDDEVDNQGGKAEGIDLADAGTGKTNMQLTIVTYADVTTGLDFSLDSVGDIVTGGGAGDDSFEDVSVDESAGDTYLLTVSGGAGDDVLYTEALTTLKGGAGNDVIKTAAAKAYGGLGNDLIADFGGGDNTFYGEGGNDVLRGKYGDDDLFGGAGRDQGWGGPGSDFCKTEVTNRCEFVGKRGN